MTDVILPEPEWRDPPRAIVVAGAVGGAGTTSTALLLGLALAERQRRKVLVLDAAPAGGDLTARVFGAISTGHQWDAWARAGADLGALKWQLGGRDWGTVVLGADTPAPDAATLLAAVIDAVVTRGWMIVVDAGSGAPGSAVLSAGRAAGAGFVLTMPQRADAANRARWFLSRLALRCGDGLVADSVVAVSDQDGKDSYVCRAVADGLAGKVAAVVRIPTDPHLATGLTICPDDIGPATNAAVGELIEALAALANRPRPRARAAGLGAPELSGSPMRAVGR
jgi:MinD-like ATPase involved in chromosome partitioning or flagellar assembly